MEFLETKYSNLDKFNKKEKINIESKFPFIIPSEKLEGVEILGQKVDKTDISLITKFCPLCDNPMIVRMLYIPCDHVVCYSCSKPESKNCYVCNIKLDKLVRIPDKTKLYECDFSNCFKFYDGLEKLIGHRITEHNLPMEIAQSFSN